MTQPTPEQLIAQTRQALQAQLIASTSQPPLSVVQLLDVFAMVHGGMLSGLYHKLEQFERQQSLDTSSGIYLEDYAALLQTQRIPAAFASGQVLIQTNKPNSMAFSQGTRFRAAGGMGYEALEAIEAESYAPLPQSRTQFQTLCKVRSLEPCAETNQAPKTPLLFESTSLAALSQVKVDQGGLIGGRGPENDQELRHRLLGLQSKAEHRYGRTQDFQAWAMESSTEVEHAWVLPMQDAAGLLKVVCLGKQGKLPPEILTWVNQYLASKVIAGTLYQVCSATYRPLKLRLSPSHSQERAEALTILRTYLRTHALLGQRPRLSELRNCLIREGMGALSTHLSMSLSDRTPWGAYEVASILELAA